MLETNSRWEVKQAGRGDFNNQSESSPNAPHPGGANHLACPNLTMASEAMPLSPWKDIAAHESHISNYSSQLFVSLS
jgi:hypothetical protein